MGSLDEAVALRHRLTRGWALPQLLRPAQVTLVTGQSYESIRYLLDSGGLAFVQARPGGMRLVPIEEVARYCDEFRIVPAWDTLE